MIAIEDSETARVPPKRVLLAVTHLLGVGHFARMAALGRALAAAGSRVFLVSGGRPVRTIALEGIELLQLPAIHCKDADFTRLYAEDGALASPELMARRATAMAEAVRAFLPEVVITELFPFGRRALREEYDALLAEAQALEPRPAILCSIRDVLNPPTKPGRADWVLDRLAQDYDGVIIHGDAAAMPLEASWPVTPPLARRLTYAGYLRDFTRDAPARVVADARQEIIVSGGGSSVGLRLSRIAIEASRAVIGRPWRILVSDAIAPEDFAALQSSAPGHVVVERSRSDFPVLLASAALSISQAGYNTMLDLASAGPRAILVPFAAGSEKEQTLRAEALATRGLARVISEAELDPERLIATIRETLAEDFPDVSSIRLDGDRHALDAITAASVAAKARHAAWNDLRSALAAARLAGQKLDVWIRDDDAVDVTPELETFLDLLARHDAPAAFAVIPANLKAALPERLARYPKHDVLVHGYSHRNRATEGERAAEFGAHRLADIIAEEFADGLRRLSRAFGNQALPVFVPPWNRIASSSRALLAGAGFSGLSTFGPALPEDAGLPLMIANSDWDPIAWRTHRGLKDEAKLLRDLVNLVQDRLAQPTDTRQPIGLLTHHLVHDGWITRFLDELLGCLAASRAVRFVPARDVFKRRQ